MAGSLLDVQNVIDGEMKGSLYGFLSPSAREDLTSHHANCRGTLSTPRARFKSRHSFQSERVDWPILGHSWSLQAVNPGETHVWVYVWQASPQRGYTQNLLGLLRARIDTKPIQVGRKAECA